MYTRRLAELGRAANNLRRSSGHRLSSSQSSFLNKMSRVHAEYHTDRYMQGMLKVCGALVHCFIVPLPAEPFHQLSAAAWLCNEGNNGMLLQPYVCANHHSQPHAQSTTTRLVLFAVSCYCETLIAAAAHVQCFLTHRSIRAAKFNSATGAGANSSIMTASIG